MALRSGKSGYESLKSPLCKTFNVSWGSKCVNIIANCHKERSAIADRFLAAASSRQQSNAGLPVNRVNPVFPDSLPIADLKGITIKPVSQSGC